jgi:hypothetical protein
MLKKISVAFLILIVPSLMALGNSRQASVARGPDYPELKLAVDLVRVINTAQMTYRDQSAGMFAAWNDLSRSQGFGNAIDNFAHGDPKLKDVKLDDPSDIMPGWRLRLTVAPDKKSYIVFLERTSDQKRYAFVSDEEGVIWQATAL